MTQLSIPATLRAGDTLSARWSHSAHPATAGWVLRLTLGNAAASYQASAAAAGSDHALTVTAATTADWATGNYSWVIDATQAALRSTLASGAVVVLPNLSATTPLDTRSNYRKALDAAEAALASHGARAYLSGIEMGERKQTFTSPGEFLAFISRLRFEVQREANLDRLRQGLSSRSTLLTRLR